MDGLMDGFVDLSKVGIVERNLSLKPQLRLGFCNRCIVM